MYDYSTVGHLLKQIGICYNVCNRIFSAKCINVTRIYLVDAV